MILVTCCSAHKEPFEIRESPGPVSTLNGPGCWVMNRIEYIQSTTPTFLCHHHCLTENWTLSLLKLESFLCLQRSILSTSRLDSESQPFHLCIRFDLELGLNKIQLFSHFVEQRVIVRIEWDNISEIYSIIQYILGPCYMSMVVNASSSMIPGLRLSECSAHDRE